MTVILEDNPVKSRPTARELDDARRAREFYHYFQPDNLIQPELRHLPSVLDVSDSAVPDISRALSPIAQLTTIRMNCRKTMINVIDREVMYFLSEATKVTIGDREEMYEFVEDPILLACSSVPLKGKICELTVRLDQEDDPAATPMFVINDLTKSEFAHMPIITGPPYYRFYAGVPITTKDGINIGSLAVMDTNARPNGLTPAEINFLATTAAQIMLFLETNRQAIEGRQARLMAQGMEAFIGGRKSIYEEKNGFQHKIDRKERSKSVYGMPPSLDGEPAEAPDWVGHANEPSTPELSSDTEDVTTPADTSDESRSHSRTFARAANVLRECMGYLGEDGVAAFLHLGTSSGAHKRRNARIPGPNAVDVNGKSHVAAPKASFLAYSTEANQTLSDKVLEEKLVSIEAPLFRDLLKRYPTGRVFVLDGNAASSSEDENAAVTPTVNGTRRPSRRKQLEHNALRAVFPAARQVMFTPLWDAATGSYTHACLIAAASETRSFSADVDLPFLNSFCNTLMGECSRLDAIQADKQKSDFVGTISHEMRSPLHGLLASVEFLAETDLSGFQKNLISTIDSCGRTLLDTINHVLDFSKINSFQKQWQTSNKKHNHGNRRYTFLGPENTAKPISHGAPALLQLLGVVDVSAILEEVVDGLVLGHTYNSGLELTDMSREARGRGMSKSSPNFADRVKIMLDVQKADWMFLTQPGAVRRIIMNLTGNAIKYTSKGSITVTLRLRPSPDNKDTESLNLVIKDTGRGISQNFLNSKLFLPFAQENALAPGTGLGLSIVRSIVLMLGGVIDVKSDLQKGTTVEVNLPVKRPMPGQTSTQTTPYSDGTGANSTASSVDSSLVTLREQWTDASVTLWQSNRPEGDALRQVIQSYVQDWYNLTFLDQRLCEQASIVIVEEEDLELLLEAMVVTPRQRPALVVICSVSSKHTATLVQCLEERIMSAVEFVSEPCGPHKLARGIESVLGKQVAIATKNSRSFNQHAIPPPIQLNNLAPVVPEPDSLTEHLADLDLNPPGGTDDSQVVQASETFAASQASDNAQMALHDPITALRTPRNHVSEGDAFPFPAQEEENSKLRRESQRLTLNKTLSDEATPMPPPQDMHLRTLSSPRPLVNEVNPNVLLVDDNRINLKLLHTFLTNKRKYTKIVLSEDGQQAVDAVKSAKEPFDIIFMDISMPILDGFEATRAIRDHEDALGTKPGAMVIALTGLASARDQAEVFNSGCDIYMTKPVSFKEVGKLLNNWEAHQSMKASSEVNGDG